MSPYLKTLSMVASTKLLHLLEAFSTPWFLFSAPQNHHLVFFLLEIFNNIIQYQFDGNSNLVYTIIRKRQVCYSSFSLSQLFSMGLFRFFTDWPTCQATMVPSRGQLIRKRSLPSYAALAVMKTCRRRQWKARTLPYQPNLEP